MRVHLTKYDVVALRKQVAESEELADDGEFFAEEALGCFDDSEIDAIEELYGGAAEDLLMEVYGRWDGAEPSTIMDATTKVLSVSSPTTRSPTVGPSPIRIKLNNTSSAKQVATRKKTMGSTIIPRSSLPVRKRSADRAGRRIRIPDVDPVNE